jgi:hypothetical protein
MSNNRVLAVIGAVGVLAASGSAAVADSNERAAAGHTTPGRGADSVLVAASSPVLTAADTPIGGGDAAALSPLVVLGLVPGGGGAHVGQPIAGANTNIVGGVDYTAAGPAGAGALRVVGPNFFSPSLIRMATPTLGRGSAGGPAVSPMATDSPMAALSMTTTAAAVPSWAGGGAFLGLIGPGGLLIGDGLDGDEPGEAGGNGGLLWGNGGRGAAGAPGQAGGAGGSGGLFFGNGGAGGAGGLGARGGDGGNAAALFGSGGAGGAGGAGAAGAAGVNPLPNGSTAASGEDGHLAGSNAGVLEGEAGGDGADGGPGRAGGNGGNGLSVINGAGGSAFGGAGGDGGAGGAGAPGGNGGNGGSAVSEHAEAFGGAGGDGGDGGTGADGGDGGHAGDVGWATTGGFGRGGDGGDGGVRHVVLPRVPTDALGE